MFYRFNAHKYTEEKSNNAESKYKDRAARMAAVVLLKIQRRWARFMPRQAGKLPAKHLKILLVVAGFAASIFCVVLITCVPRGLVPVFFQTVEEGREGEGITQKRALYKQLAFGAYLDSLGKEIITDSINHLQTIKK